MTVPDPEPKSPRVTDIRLPTELKPVNYVVKLQPFINGNFSIMGSVEIEIEVLEATSNVTLHILDIITTNETVKVIYYKFQEEKLIKNFFHKSSYYSRKQPLSPQQCVTAVYCHPYHHLLIVSV